MERYKNLGRDSGVTAFEIGVDSIIVEFKTGATYLYNHLSTGQADIERMKILATAGTGLNSFIVKHVKKRFAKKLR
jgi:hypothetical protein